MRPLYESVKEEKSIADKMTEDEAINILKTMCTDNFCIEQLKTKQAIETILDLYQQEKEMNKQVTKIANEYKSWWINLGNEIKHIRDKAELMDYYGLVDVIKDLNKLIGDKEDE